MRFLSMLLLILTFSTSSAALKIEGPSSHKRDSFVELKAVGAEGSSVLWDVFPEGVATTKEEAGWLVINGPPGTYNIRATSYGIKDGKVIVERAKHTLTIEGVSPPPPPPAPGKALAAIGQIRFGTSGCTATLITSSYPGTLALTAAHCIKSVGQTGTIQLKDGRSFTVRVLVFNRTSDVAWLDVDTKGASVPLAQLADAEPPVGTKIWHNGYGVDKPNNREEGSVIGAPTSQGQLVYHLSVSPGDSGGGIVVDSSDRVLSPVCCTTCLGCMGTVYGGSVAAVRAIMPKTKTDIPSSEETSAPCCGAELVTPVKLPAIRPPNTDSKIVHPILHVVPQELRPTGLQGAGLFYPIKELGKEK